MGGHDLQARPRRAVEPAHLSERIGGRVPSAPVVVHAAGPTGHLEAGVVEFDASVEARERVANHRLGCRELGLVAAVGQQFDGSRGAGGDPQVPLRRSIRDGNRPTGRPVVDGSRADPRGPGVVLVIGLVDRVRPLERAVAGRVGVEEHHPRVGDGRARRGSSTVERIHSARARSGSFARMNRLSS